MTIHSSTLRLFIVMALALCAGVVTAHTKLPPQSVVLPGISEDSLQAIFDETDLQPLEGIWSYPEENMTLAIMRHSADTNDFAYRIILVSSDDLDLLPGTVMGYIASTAVSAKFKLWLYSEKLHALLRSPIQCVATLNADASSLTFNPTHISAKLRLNITRFLPSLFKGISIYPEVNGDKPPVGFSKIYPAEGNGNPFKTIRYL